MAARANWRVFKIGEVSCLVALYTAANLITSTTFSGAL